MRQEIVKRMVKAPPWSWKDSKTKAVYLLGG